MIFELRYLARLTNLLIQIQSKPQCRQTESYITLTSPNSEQYACVGKKLYRLILNKKKNKYLYVQDTCNDNIVRNFEKPIGFHETSITKTRFVRTH